MTKKSSTCSRICSVWRGSVLLVGLLALSACQPSANVKTPDCIDKAAIPQPLWIEQDALQAIIAAPASPALDDYLESLTVQQEQLELIHGK